MELRHLRYFVAVAEEENVSRAALKLHVSQPGVSRQIRDLEEEIGFQLFERSAKSLRLTAAGKTFLDEARAVLHRVEEAVKKARSVVGSTEGEIDVGYAPSLTIEILPRALRAFAGKYPKVRVALHDLSTEEMGVAIAGGESAGGVDGAGRERKMLRGLEFKELARYTMCVAVAPKHALARLKVITLAQVAGEPLIAYSRKEYPEYHAMLQKLFAATGRKPRIAEEHDGVTSIVAAVESGGGLALMPSCVACMAGPRLKLIPMAAPAPEIPVGAAWRNETGVRDLVKGFVEGIDRVTPRKRRDVAE